jgi:hypothetical protein
MKNIINLFVSFSLLLFITSCNDAIDISPDDQLNQDVTFETVGDLQLGLNGAYARYDLENEILLNSVFADNVKPGVDSGGQQIPFYNWTLTAGTGQSTAIWNSYYSMINQVNRVLEASPLVIVEDTEQDDFDNIVGQLHALRAAAHYHLLTYFTTDYQDDSALSVIVADRVPGTSEQFNRNTNGDVYELINSDIVLAEGLISETNNSFLTQDFVTGLKARISLLRGNPNAATFAQELIDSYPLATQAQYQAMYLDTDDTEVIFKLVRTPANGLIGGLWYFTGSAGAFLEASNSLYDELDVNDIRREVLINFSDSNGGPSVPEENFHLINKYPGNSTPFLANVKAMRVSEMYLIKAETQAKANNLSGAAETLKVLRDARFGAATTLDDYNTLNQALTAVMNERRIELAYEGHRYLDIKRTKDVLNMGIERDDLDCEAGGSCELPPSSFKFTLPIPQVEINSFPSIIQNPGYGNNN